MSDDRPSWDDLEIPHTWTATSMLRSMVSDHLGPNVPIHSTLDEETRQRMIGLAVLGHLELAEKVARLLNIVEAIANQLGIKEGY